MSILQQRQLQQQQQLQQELPLQLDTILDELTTLLNQLFIQLDNLKRLLLIDNLVMEYNRIATIINSFGCARSEEEYKELLLIEQSMKEFNYSITEANQLAHSIIHHSLVETKLVIKDFIV